MGRHLGLRCIVDEVRTCNYVLEVQKSQVRVVLRWREWLSSSSTHELESIWFHEARNCMHEQSTNHISLIKQAYRCMHEVYNITSSPSGLGLLSWWSVEWALFLPVCTYTCTLTWSCTPASMITFYIQSKVSLFTQARVVLFRLALLDCQQCNGDLIA